MAGDGRSLPRHDVGCRVHLAFTRRTGGRSDAPYDSLNLGDHVGDDAAVVAANRQRVADEIGVGAGHVVYMQQVHGRAVAVVDGPVAEPVPEVDALVTATPGLALAVFVADCAPVLLADRTAGVVAAVHAGRRGLQLDVVGAAMRAMSDLGARPTRIHWWIGPTICGRCYEVPAAMQAEVGAVSLRAVSTTRQGTPGLDIRHGVADQLHEWGIPQDHGVHSADCTMEQADLFSHRRDGVTGRQAGVIWLTPPPHDTARSARAAAGTPG